MLMPKRVKHRKQFRGSMSGKATRGNTITYGAVSYTHLPGEQAYNYPSALTFRHRSSLLLHNLSSYLKST